MKLIKPNKPIWLIYKKIIFFSYIIGSYIAFYTNEIFAGKDINQESKTESKLDNTEKLIHGHLLNNLLCKESNQLEEINSILQYLGQVINKGTIKIENKKEIQTWICKHQEIVRNLKEFHSFPLLESKLYRISLLTKSLTIHIINAIDSKFKNLKTFETSVYSSSKDITIETKNITKDITIEKIEEVVNLNSNLIKILKDKARQTGLTNVNKIARYIDNIIEKYNLINFFDILPAATAIGITCIYFTPKRYLENIPILSKIKNWLGTSSYFDPTEEEKIKQAAKKNTGVYDKILNLIKSKDFKALETGAVLVAPFLSKKPLSPVTASIRSNIRRWWSKVKGFDIPSNATYKIIENITLDDERLIGVQDQVDELKKIVRYVSNPEIYDRSGSNLDKGILLIGPPGNGKTFCAQALAGTINKEMSKKGSSRRFSFRELKWHEIRWSSDGIKTMIEQAKRNAPCILFIDEIHNLPLQTKEDSGDTLTEFLTGMSGINSENDSNYQVIILAATNQPEMLDAALLRTGRFSTKIRFEKPNYQNRKKYFEVMLKRDAIDTTFIDIDSLVRQTEGCSYSDLESIVKGAKFTAMELAESITQKHLQSKINTLVHKFKEELPLTDLELKHISSHQAGHALMYMLLDTQEKLELVSIAGRWRKIKEGRFFDAKTRDKMYEGKNTKYGALIKYNPAESIKIENDDEKIKLAKIKLAGPLAEKLLLGSTGYTSLTESYKKTFHTYDRNKALEYFKEIVYGGFDRKILPKDIVKENDKQAYKMLEKYEQEVLELLNKHRTILEIIAQELKERKTLSANELRKLVKS